MSSNHFDLEPAPSDAISSLSFSTSSTKLLVASWDRNVYLYNAQESEDGQLIQQYEHRAPVLDVCFGDDDNVAYSVGLDWDVRRIDLESGEQTVLSSHEAPVKAVVYSPKHHLLVSASWDKTLHIHHTNKPELTPATLSLPGKPFAMSLSPSKLIVAMANRLIHIYDISAMAMISGQASQPPPNSIDLEPFQTRESSLKFMTRALACMPDDAGYASSSIEGRVAVEWFDASDESQARKYAFKCHRQPAPADPDDPEAPPTDVVYPVHALAFHPVHGTFVSGGGDGVVALWDAAAKRRIRQYAKYPASVASMSFSHDGTFLAVGVSPGFEEGKEDEVGQGIIKVSIRQLAEGEAKGKNGK